MYYGWNHDAAQMQMMHLPDYLDSFRLGYERALEDLQGQLATLTQAYAPTGYTPPGAPQRWSGRGGRPEQHGHHEHHGTSTSTTADATTSTITTTTADAGTATTAAVTAASSTRTTSSTPAASSGASSPSRSRTTPGRSVKTSSSR